MSQTVRDTRCCLRCGGSLYHDLGTLYGVNELTCLHCGRSYIETRCPMTGTSVLINSSDQAEIPASLRQPRLRQVVPDAESQ